MKKTLDNVKGSPVALDKQTNKRTSCTKIWKRLEVQITRTSNFYARKWGDWYLISGHSGDCL